MGSDVPALGVLIDLPLGIVMWCAILRFLLSMVVKEDSRAGIMRLLNGAGSLNGRRRSIWHSCCSSSASMRHRWPSDMTSTAMPSCRWNI